jgi:hypothetical protein
MSGKILARSRQPQARKGSGRSLESLKRALAQLKRDVGADVYRQCEQAIRRFSRGSGWIGDDPYIDATIGNLDVVSRDTEVLRGYMPIEKANAKARAKYLGNGARSRGRPPLPVEFKKMENELMCILTASGSTAIEAANRTLLLVGGHLLKPNARYSVRAILKRWNATLIP